MVRVTLLLLLASGQAANDTASVTAKLLDAPALQQAIGSDLGGNFTVIEVTLSPKSGKSIDVTMDDFLLRDDSNGDHTGPVVAVQVVGTGGVVVHKEDVPTGYSSPVAHEVTGITKATSSAPMNTALFDAVKKKILPEKTIGDPLTGLLFFPLGKTKAKNLDLVYSTPQGKLHVRFR